jgi:hypothetical protein
MLKINLKLLIFCILSFFISTSSLYAKEEVSSYLVGEKAYQTLTKEQTHHLKTIQQNGTFAMGSIYGDQNAITWAKKFSIVELGGIDDDRITHQMFDDKRIMDIPHHIGYDWMPAFYYYTREKNREIVDWLYKNKNETTLNPDGPFIHCKKNHYDWCQDFYYNLGNQDVFDAKIADLRSNMKSKGFNGVFFDWADGSYLLDDEYKSMLENFKKQNPKKDYLQEVGKFYKKLDELGIFIVTNQAFREHTFLLPYIKYDMTESYITTDINQKKRMQIEGKGWVKEIQTSNYYPASSKAGSIRDTITLIDRLTDYKQKYQQYGFVNFIYLNYLAPEYEKLSGSESLYRTKKPKNGIYYSYAMAKLTDNIVYTQVPYDTSLERDNIYFYDLGRPLGMSYFHLNAIDGYVRFYSNGFVLASSPYQSDKYLKLISSFLPKKRVIYDLYNGIWIKSDEKSVTLKLHFEKETFNHQTLPLGRVFIYAN